jgi:hypothetical protein
MSFVFGKVSEATCIQDLPTPGPNGEALCLAYRTESYGFVFSGYLRDAGYVIKSKNHRTYWTLDDATIADYQQRGVLPAPLPSYSIPASTYAWGFALWPALVLAAVVAVLRRRTAARRHATDVAPRPEGSAIEVTASYSILGFMLVLCAPTITIDGTPHLRSWGTWSFPVAPGRHEVKVSYTWLWERGIASREVEVGPGEMICLRYHHGPFLSRLTQLATTPVARVERDGASER